MTQWNPNLFRIEGRSRGYSEDYLNALIRQGTKTNSQHLPVIFSLAHLARLSRVQYSDLHSIVSRQGIDLKDFPYKNFSIAKRSGGRRWISIPNPKLMSVQQWINQSILRQIQPHSAAFAYARGRRLVDHARQHCSCDWLVKIDIKDFFSNISEIQIFSVFREAGYPKLLSFELARICTRVTPKRPGKRWKNSSNRHSIPEYYSEFIGSLPQGSPTSPALSNLACRKLDVELTELALSSCSTYSRYADDLCFSLPSGDRKSALKIMREACAVIQKHNFIPNEKKTRIIPPGGKKILTGLNVDSTTPTTPKEVRDMVRLHLYYAKKIGLAKHCEARGFRSISGFQNHLSGLIGYISSIEPKRSSALYAQFNALPWLHLTDQQASDPLISE
ncbi:TPA: RNA-directed DNA polymerase [Stenotrophomonas maltophilia]|nr:RNA-directed DNA polymerase [Stenotrophomonas maltophilia]HDS0951754.1 RNA-directed DNA polymerase [Stenotrophomonas maltophilia]HDS1025440.1 RNA-directed DNA polymerase [Stenotrophomonas maltophilia]HDS1028177.1 RNA-directed DNA polymerase [Stenotrophomonas maltophilia]HDS1029690.1 RNA-directed DNA polymerase [Stenotrophomonas maltophilia]